MQTQVYNAAVADLALEMFPTDQLSITGKYNQNRRCKVELK